MQQAESVAHLPNIIEVIVLATSTNALLRIGGAGELPEGCCRIGCAEEDCLVLIHARICEEQGGVVHWHHR